MGCEMIFCQYCIVKSGTVFQEMYLKAQTYYTIMNVNSMVYVVLSLSKTVSVQKLPYNKDKIEIAFIGHKWQVLTPREIFELVGVYYSRSKFKKFVTPYLLSFSLRLYEC